MHLGEAEQILKVYRHHPTPFVLLIFKTVVAFLPFYVLLLFLAGSLTISQSVIAHLIIFALFVLVITYQSLVYWLDRMVITNERVINIDWKYLTIRNESEALIKDIQDIKTKEKGILAHFNFFDYGSIRLETASSLISIEFNDAPDPEGIRKFIYHVKSQ
ncbi:hypothetical protein HY604_00320 [Candidatus Peregrinibacteria bacterium]|nr:hypothetical protein [Candidatus Peregrinibacteria bacterium]